MAAVTGRKSPAGPMGSSSSTKLYFAYGSNLHLRQMRRRCRGCKYLGHARLANYRWQINQRGYANIIPSEGTVVDGLVYEITEQDEARLDLSEGVSKKAYSKQYLTVLLYRAHSVLYRRPVTWIVDNGGPEKIVDSAKADDLTIVEELEPWKEDVLVYISLDNVEDSKPRDEYVRRINLGIADATSLGMKKDYIQTHIRPIIPEV